MPRKSVAGSSPWNPIYCHCLVILASRGVSGIRLCHRDFNLRSWMLFSESYCSNRSSSTMLTSRLYPYIASTHRPKDFGKPGWCFGLIFFTSRMVLIDRSTISDCIWDSGMKCEVMSFRQYTRCLICDFFERFRDRSTSLHRLKPE